MIFFVHTFCNSGVLGGSNAFNFINFVAGVVTLVVNVNNNINNNNNNLNNVAVNTNNANNADANVNNQGANIVIAMPGRKRRSGRSSVPYPFDLQVQCLTEKLIWHAIGRQHINFILYS